MKEGDRVGVADNEISNKGSMAVKFDDASGFDSVRKGTNVTTPKLESFLKSYIDWLIACWSVVPHQLFEASNPLE